MENVEFLHLIGIEQTTIRDETIVKTANLIDKLVTYNIYDDHFTPTEFDEIITAFEAEQTGEMFEKWAVLHSVGASKLGMKTEDFVAYVFAQPNTAELRLERLRAAYFAGLRIVPATHRSKRTLRDIKADIELSKEHTR